MTPTPGTVTAITRQISSNDVMGPYGDLVELKIVLEHHLAPDRFTVMYRVNGRPVDPVTYRDILLTLTAGRA